MTSKKMLLLAVAISVVIVSGSVAFYLVFVKAPRDMAHNVASGIREIFNFTPQVRVNETVVIEQTTPILEVATVSRQMFIEHSWQQTWMGSTKTIQIQGFFLAKAGFDLRQPFRFDIEKNARRVVAFVPPAKLLSLEMEDYKILKDEGGWWNSITSQDREEAVRQMRAQAIEKVTESGLLRESTASVEERVRELVQRNGSKAVFGKVKAGETLRQPPQ